MPNSRPKDMTMGQFLFVVNKKIKLGHEQAIYNC